MFNTNVYAFFKVISSSKICCTERDVSPISFLLKGLYAFNTDVSVPEANTTADSRSL